METWRSRHRHGRGWSGGTRPADLGRLADSPSTLVLAFGSSAYRASSRAINELHAAFPSAHVLGCSTAGEIAGTSVDDGTLSVAVARFEHTTLVSASEPVGPDAFDAGARVASQLPTDGLVAAIVLSTSDGVNGTRLVEGLKSRLGDVPLCGGLAADGTRFGPTWILAKGRYEHSAVAVVGLYGERLAVGFGSHAGWDKFGPERPITRSRGNVVYEFGGRPALDLYEAYLGDLAAGMPATAMYYPMAIRSDRSADPIVRSVLAHSPADRSVTFAGDMPEGALAQLMRGNADRLVLAAEKAGAEAFAATPGAKLCVAVSCVGRRLVLGDRCEEETEAIADAISHRCELVGYYSYGEIAPTLGKGGALHNQTMTVTTFAEE